MCLQRGRSGLDPWVGKIPWRRARQPTPVYLPGESPWTEKPGGLQPMGLQNWTWLSDEAHSTHFCITKFNVHFFPLSFLKISSVVPFFRMLLSVSFSILLGLILISTDYQSAFLAQRSFRMLFLDFCYTPTKGLIQGLEIAAIVSAKL